MKKIGIKDVISENFTDKSLQTLLNEIDTNEINAIDKIVDINISDVHPNPFQPRKSFDENKLNELANSIITHGLLTPIMVQKDKDGYMIIAGERRYRASILAKKQSIKCVICNLSEKSIEEISLIENIQRENLSVIEEAEAYQRMIDKYNYTHEQISTRVGKSREYISNIIRLLKLPNPIKDKVISKEISPGHAKTLLSLSDNNDMIDLMNQIIENKISVRKTEEIVKLKKLKQPQNLYQKEEKILEEILDKKVQITKTKLSIYFNSYNELEEIIEKMRECKINR